MKVSYDSYFCIGDYHVRNATPCQDYALAGQTHHGVNYAIVSDGCSASKDTDLGSRLIAHWFRHLLTGPINTFPSNPPDFGDDSAMKSVLVRGFVKHFESMWLRGVLPHFECLDATLLSVFIHPSYQHGYILIYGDGGFAMRGKDGVLKTFLVHSDWNAPPYLSYNMEPERRDNYIAQAGKQGSVTYITRHDHSKKDAKDEVMLAKSTHQVMEMDGLVFMFDHKDMDTIAVFTDGVCQVGQKNPHEVMAEFMDIKSPAGIFVGRTCLSNFRRLAKEGIVPSDDFAMAALKFEEEERVEENPAEGGGKPADAKPE